jgi:integrase
MARSWVRMYERKNREREAFAWEVRSFIDGKYRTESFSFRKHGKRKAKEKADDYLTDLKKKLRDGSYVDSSVGDVTLQQVFEDYLRSTRKNGRPLGARTVAWYEGLWRAYIAPAPGTSKNSLGLPALALMTLNQVKREHVRKLRDEMVRHFESQENRDGRATIRAVLQMLRAVFNQAIEDALLTTQNPAEHIRSPKRAPREARFLTAEEVDAVAAEVPERYRALVLVLAHCGLRIGEAAALRVSDVDELQRRIRVTRSAGEVRGLGWQEGGTKTGRNRSVPLPRFVSDELVAHIAAFAGGKDALLFTGPDGGPIRVNNWRKRTFYTACERARSSGKLDQDKPIPHVHDLRHTAASLMIQAGVDMKSVQDALGHASITMTIDLYSHVSDELRDTTADKLDAAYGSAKGGV